MKSRRSSLQPARPVPNSQAEFRHLRNFLGIAEAGGFGRAAQKLRVAQSALSRQMQALEADLGAPLLLRVSDGVRLTPAGEALMRVARDMVDRTGHMLDKARLAHRGLAGECVIGMGRLALWGGYAGRAIPALQERFPAIEFTVREIAAPELWDALRAGEVMVGVGVSPPVGPALDAEALYQDPIECVLLPASHPLASSSVVASAELQGLPLFLPPSFGTRPFRPDLEEVLAILGTDQYEIRAPLSSLWFDIAAGKGWSVGPRSFLERPPDGTVARPMKGLSVPLAVAMGWMVPAPPLVYNVLGVLRQVAAGPNAAAAGVVPVAPVPRVGIPPGFELRLLRAFLTVVEAGSIGAAARTMGLTQGAVSRQIDRLEHVLGCQVLVRTAGGVRSTPAGTVLERDGPELLAQMTSGIDTARRAARGIRGRCTVGRVSTELTRAIIVGIIEDLGHRLPDVVVDVVEVMSPDQPERLRSRTIDLGLTHAMLPREATAGMGRMMVVPDPLECALLSAEHPLAARPLLTPQDLATETFLLPPRSFQPAFYDRVCTALAGLGLGERINDRYEGLHTIWALVQERRGWTVGSGFQRTAPPPGLVAVPVDGLHIPFGIELIWRLDESDAAIRSVLDAIRGCTRERDLAGAGR